MIEVDAIIKNERGFAAKDFSFDYPACWDSNNYNEVLTKLKEDPECFMYIANYAHFPLSSPDQTLCVDGFDVTVRCWGNRSFEIIVDNTFSIHSSKSTTVLLENYLNAKESAAVLNKINRVGLMTFVKNYLAILDSELKVLQDSEINGKLVQSRISDLATLVSSIKQWLFLNE